ncbi:hypothetical protein [Hymenobacter sp. BT559]|jgi:hypothetical protein|uniref:hypothetical protein n=1 Tax=Hymenobacter sp. BT559 TaxID=2795729 RepID=UPI0018ECB645|nr:hypothetical protein [Hymenobacter sp. BT559]MBJ6143762.1 hypothetical protein [Hymenobacter sp. BT559]
MNYISEIESSIQSLFAATSAGFTQDASAGQSQVGNWLNSLQSSNDPALRPIAQELDVLNRAIGSGDASAMAKSFYQLGNLTGKAALNLHAFGGVGDKLRELSQKLISAGGNLQIIGQQQNRHAAHH